MKLGAKIFGVLSAGLILFLLLGLLLPGAWEAEANAILPASPSSVFPFLDRVEGWLAWNPMPASGSELSGPPQGEGAGFQWDDPQYGEGWFRILRAREDSLMEYEVQIEEGALVIRGLIVLTPEGSGSRLHWVERGDFGWNPLMGFAARGMAESQGAAMSAKLDTLVIRLSRPGKGSDSEGM